MALAGLLIGAAAAGFVCNVDEDCSLNGESLPPPRSDSCYIATLKL